MDKHAGSPMPDACPHERSTNAPVCSCAKLPHPQQLESCQARVLIWHSGRCAICLMWCCGHTCCRLWSCQVDGHLLRLTLPCWLAACAFRIHVEHGAVLTADMQADSRSTSCRHQTLGQSGSIVCRQPCPTSIVEGNALTTLQCRIATLRPPRHTARHKRSIITSIQLICRRSGARV